MREGEERKTRSVVALASFSLSIQERYMQDLNTLLLLRHTTSAATTMLPTSMMRLVVNYRRYVNLLKWLSLSERERGAECEIFNNDHKNTNKSGIHSAEISYSLKAHFYSHIHHLKSSHLSALVYSMKSANVQHDT